MNRYTIYCTEAQTKKALELGAPIESEFEYQFLANQEHGYYRGGTFQGLIECMGENTAVFGNEPNRAACIIPTAEQIIGWLEEKDIFISINHIGAGYSSWLKTISTNENISENLGYVFTHKEAILAAIDAALEYLIDNSSIK